jgi:hypothetical protein
MIIFPFGVDQSGNAARVTRVRVGLSGDIRTVTAETISSMLQAVERPPFREYAVRLSKVVRVHSNCEDAVAAIEKACANHADASSRDSGGIDSRNSGIFEECQNAGRTRQLNAAATRRRGHARRSTL